jgi:hypothetical protein
MTWKIVELDRLLMRISFLLTNIVFVCSPLALNNYLFIKRFYKTPFS